ncbi:MAG TPA: glycosyltransferase family 39 protein, partial [Dissulfurispiraceae bacterium]|nr:glycosyltransferase family 39 protein [Dissulfurispiraceae bacterium]
RVYVGVHYPGDVIAGAALGSCIALTLIACFNFAKKRHRANPHATVLVSTLVAISLFRIFYILHGPLDLSPDEAHYWEWSRRLDLSYYSKGPAIAYLIHLGTSLFGDTEFGVRFMAILFSALGSSLLFRLVQVMYDDSLTALYTALLFQIVPLYAAFGVIFTIDSPFLFFWIASLLLMWRAVSSEQLRNDSSSAPPEPHIPVTLWIALGVALGLGLLTKYTMAFFAMAAFLFLVFSEKRSLLKTAGPYLALVISAVIFSPVILWNAHHDWITLKHTAGQAHLAEGFSFNLKYFLEFLGSQAGVVTPILFIMVWYGLYKYRKGENSLSHGFLVWFSLPIVLFFLLKSLQGKVQANWAMMGYITGMIPLAHMAAFSNSRASSAPRRERTITRAGIVLALLITVFAYSVPALGILPPSLDPSARLRGWKELGREISRIAASLATEGDVLLFSDSYQVASELAFYVRGHPVTYCINLGRRMNQYDLWPDINNAAERIKKTRASPSPINAVYVRIGNRSIQEPVAQAFDSCEKNTLRVVQRGHLIREYSIFVCYNFRGLKTEPSTIY